MTENSLDYCGGVFGAVRHGGGAQRAFALPGDQPHYARDRLVNVRHIKLEISLDPEEKRIEGAAHTTFVPINDGLSHVEFDAAEREITSVRIAGRRPRARYRYDGARLRHELGLPRHAREEAADARGPRARPRPQPPPPGQAHGVPQRGTPATVPVQAPAQDPRLLPQRTKKKLAEPLRRSPPCAGDLAVGADPPAEARGNGIGIPGQFARAGARR